MNDNVATADLPSAALRWCILRTSAGRTLLLARSLAEAGFDVWTPKLVVSRQKPRSKVVVKRDAPIMPTFVFARSTQLTDLMLALAQPVSPHPPFWLFRYAGRVPQIDDREVANLRLAEERSALAERKSKRRIVPVGSSVRVEEGSFTGLTGVVERSRGKAAVVHFGGGFRVEIAAWLLVPDAVPSPQSLEDVAARAA